MTVQYYVQIHLGVTEVAVDALQDDGAVAQGDADALEAQGDAGPDAGEGLEGQAAARGARDAQQGRHQPPQLVLGALLLPQPVLVQPARATRK